MDPDSRILILYLLMIITFLGIYLGTVLTELTVFVRGDISAPHIP